MISSLAKAIEIAEETYFGYHVAYYWRVDGVYYFIMKSASSQFPEIHSVNATTFEVSGNIPLMELLMNDKMRGSMSRGRKVDIFQHTGVKGMRWGSNGMAKDHDYRVRLGLEQPVSTSKRNMDDKDWRAYRKEYEKENGKIRTKFSKAKIGKEAVGAILGAVAGVGINAVLMYNTGVSMPLLPAGLLMTGAAMASNDWQTEQRYDRSKLSEKMDLDTTIEASKDCKKIQGSHSEIEDCQKVNPVKHMAGTNNNCMLCSTAYEMRRRGYDVCARNLMNGNGMYDDEISKYFKGAKVDNIGNDKSWNTVSANFEKKYPVGARGNLMVAVNSGLLTYGMYGNHSMAFERKQDGTYVYDAQSGQTYNMNDPKFRDSFSSYYVQAIRTDNLDINWNRIGDAVANAR